MIDTFTQIRKPKPLLTPICGTRVEGMMQVRSELVLCRHVSGFLGSGEELRHRDRKSCGQGFDRVE
ncbi:hypothetical protein [Nocardiopsis synnemataformans]|uniref:hypothetical protein n=1 Tax=Nocardiopsis synnemataformans TaxID=61305 RepID=UPI003EBF374F